jgi:hypothetical protein
MHDDDFERELERRLRGYESRLPDVPPPGAMAATRPGWWRFAAGGAMAALVLVAAVVGVLFTGRDGRGVGDATPQPSPTATSADASPSPSSAPPSGEPSVSVAASPSAVPAPTQSVPADWTATADFAVPDERYIVSDMTAWSGGLIAVGTHYVSDERDIFGPPPAHQGVVWLSADGTAWDELPVIDAFADIELTHLFITPTGSLVVIGDEWTDTDGLIDVTSTAWESADGRTWQRTDLRGLPDPVRIPDLVQGARGYLLSDGERLWWSADGRAWDAVLDFGEFIFDIGAGDDGFAAVGNGAPDGGSRRIAASADGREWIDAQVPSNNLLRVAPIGPDWLAVASAPPIDASSAQPIETWRSANALDWERAGGFVATGGASGRSCAESFGDLITAGTIAFGSTIRCGEGGLMNAGMSYASADGAEWEALPFGEAAAVRDAILLGGRLVVVTDALTGVSASTGVTFWLSAGP